jgi:DNA-binding transcriptional ArsR family regulator
MLGALGDPVRLEIIRQLADAGGMLIGPFDVQVTVSSLSHHLKALVDGGLTRVTQSGRFHRCDLRLAEVAARFPGLLPAGPQQRRKATGCPGHHRVILASI